MELLAQRGSIPASAGEPCTKVFGCLLITVYPRECGGTHSRAYRTSQSAGLSPRVRGNLIGNLRFHFHSRSIPASAGEPIRPGVMMTLLRVYPRECGGTVHKAGLFYQSQGLSPRVRGNRAHPLALGLTRRSIPASAGEPTNSSAQNARKTVYPRECGGTCWSPLLPRVMVGLSPRVRGNQSQINKSDSSSRSIPASAGEPQ